MRQILRVPTPNYPDDVTQRNVPVTHPAFPERRHHLFEQAPVEAVDIDGIRVVTTLTAAFLVAAVGLAGMYSRLAQAGTGWWLWVAVAGFLLGLVGLGYCLTRRHLRLSGRWTRD
jgi:hypothetical protein